MKRVYIHEIWIFIWLCVIDTSQLIIHDCFHQDSWIIPEKLTKMSKKNSLLMSKKAGEYYWIVPFYLDQHQKLSGSILGRDSSSI